MGRSRARRSANARYHGAVTSFVEIDEQRFELSDGRAWFYHCETTESDWLLRVEREGTQLWLGGTVGPSPARVYDLEGAGLIIEGRDLDELFGQLLGEPIVIYPNGQHVCRAHFVATVVDGELELVSGFEFEWDHDDELPPDTMRHARLELRVAVGGLYPAELPEPLP